MHTTLPACVLVITHVLRKTWQLLMRESYGNMLAKENLSKRRMVQLNTYGPEDFYIV
jgi:hypothetical protein